MATLAPTSAAVLPAIMRRYSSTLTSARCSKLMSRYWPSVSATQVRVNTSSAARTAAGGTPHGRQPLHGGKRKGKHAVAHVDGERHAPQLPDGGAMAARLVAVLDIVVHEREVVQNLDGGCRRQGAARFGPLPRHRQAGRGSGAAACRRSARRAQSWRLPNPCGTASCRSARQWLRRSPPARRASRLPAAAATAA